MDLARLREELLRGQLGLAGAFPAAAAFQVIAHSHFDRAVQRAADRDLSVRPAGQLGVAVVVKPAVNRRGGGDKFADVHNPSLSR